MKYLKIALPLFAVVAASSLLAHVTVAPRQSKLSATETYTLRVPSEGGRTTTGVVLQIPQGLTVVSVAVPKDGGGFSYERKAGGPDQVSWTVNLKPNEVALLSLTATNATEGTAIQWKIQQKYADGTSSDWTPSTTLEAASAPAAAPAAAK